MKYPRLVKKEFCTTDIDVVLEREGLSVYGEPLSSIELSLKCNYQDKAKVIYTEDKKMVKISGTAFFDGDICKELEVISGGYAIIFGIKRDIFSACKARNPDGSVNYTRLEFI